MTNAQGRPRWSRWRIAGWSAAAALLAAPAVLMQFDPEMIWDETDFIVFGLMIGSVGLAFDFLARRAGSLAYLAGAAAALLAMFLLVWINLAVGIIGSEDNPANRMYAGVLAVAVGGAAIARFRPRGMALAMAAAAGAQLLVGLIALATDAGTDGANWPRDVIGATGSFTTFWLLSAVLFRTAARSARP
jgi:hypothetical protein